MHNASPPPQRQKLSIDDMLPPPGLADVGDGDFKTVGMSIADTLRLFYGADQRFLDMGCGIGRVAIPLTQYVSEQGHYEGFDVVPSAIKYCQDVVTPAYPNFRFTLSDIYNGRYNPDGKVRAEDYRFPYDDASFDFASATSLFTHLQPAESVRYLTEAARVIKPGGKILATFFLLDAVARQFIAEQKATMYFPHQVGPNCWVADQEVPEAAVCYDAEFIFKLFDDCGFDIKRGDGSFDVEGGIFWGTWSSRTIKWGGYQDAVIATRR